MEWSKVKNIILLILLLLNGFLLVPALGRRQAGLAYARSGLTRAVEVLEQNGVEVSGETLDGADSLAPLTVGQESEGRERAARALLGEDLSGTEESGGLYACSSPLGSALFRSGGELTAQLEPIPLDGEAPAGHAAALLEKMGLSGEVVSAPEAGDGEVVLRQTLDGAPVYSCTLAFRYEGGCLRQVEGRILTAAPRPLDGEEGDTLDLPNALILFLRGILERGDVCSSVTGLRPGYRLGQFFGEEARLAPVWLVSTNVGGYYLDGVTGALERAGE